MKKLFQLLATFTAITAIIISCSKEEPIIDPIKYTLSVSAGTGGSVSTTGGIYEAGASVSVTATPNAEFEFTGWSNGSTDNPLSVTVNSNTTITANFAKVKYALNVTIEGEGTVTEEVVSTGKDYDSGTVVQYTAVPAEGWVFSSWSGAEDSIESTITLTADASKSITATFIEIPFDTASVGEGTIQTELVYNESNEATALKLTAVTPAGWRFDGWTGGVESTEMEVEVALDLAEAVTATFIQVYDLAVTIEGEGEVTEEIVVDETSKTYDSGTNVKLTAVPAEGWRFDKWTGAIESSEIEVTLTVDEAKEVTATFIKIYDLTVNTVGEGTITEEIVTTTGKTTSYDTGVTVQLTAEPAQGWRFEGWTGAVESTEAVVQVEMSEAIEVTATFINENSFYGKWDIINERCDLTNIILYSDGKIKYYTDTTVYVGEYEYVGSGLTVNIIDDYGLLDGQVNLSLNQNNNIKIDGTILDCQIDDEFSLDSNFNETLTYLPDPIFEEFLLKGGFDNQIDGYVKTSDVSEIYYLQEWRNGSSIIIKDIPSDDTRNYSYSRVNEKKLVIYDTSIEQENGITDYELNPNNDIYFIKNFTGIEDFISLENFRFYVNETVGLNLKYNQNLKELAVIGLNSNLDIKVKDGILDNVWISDYNLDAVDFNNEFTYNAKEVWFYYNNPIRGNYNPNTDFKVNNFPNTKLRLSYVSFNQNSFTLNNNYIEDLEITSSNLEVLDIQSNNLKSLNLIDNKIQTFDTNLIKSIETLKLDKNELRQIDLTSFTSLSTFSILNNRFLACILVDDTTQNLEFYNSESWLIPPYSTYTNDCTNVQPIEYCTEINGPKMIAIRMYDEYGDGWQGAYLNVDIDGNVKKYGLPDYWGEYADLNSELVNNMGSGAVQAYNSGQFGEIYYQWPVQFELNSESNVMKLNWVSGAWDSEVRIEIVWMYGLEEIILANITDPDEGVIEIICPSDPTSKNGISKNIYSKWNSKKIRTIPKSK